MRIEKCRESLIDFSIINANCFATEPVSCTLIISISFVSQVFCVIMFSVAFVECAYVCLLE